MKILLCSVPVGPLDRTLKPLFPQGSGWEPPALPVGILRINAWIEKNGYNSDIYDINNLRPSDEKLIETFKRYKPTVVGLSAPLSHCYPNVKRISKILRELFPDICIVVGGPLTGSSNVVLYKTEVDICVIGDGEIPFLKLLDYFKLNPNPRQPDFSSLHQIKGLAFIDENKEIKVTGNAEQLPASEFIYPDIDILRSGLEEFGGNGDLVDELFMSIDEISDSNPISQVDDQLYPEGINFHKKNKGKKIAQLQAVRGCVARCTFCQRYTKGYRIYPHEQLENQIIKLKEKYNVRAVNIDDENSLSNRAQSYEMARLFKKHDIYWRCQGVRVTSVTYEDLKFYKEHNMLTIRFGIESGSQKILDIMEKKFTPKDVWDTLENCKKVGVSTSADGFMIGMPGETKETVAESAEFSAQLHYMLGDEVDSGSLLRPFLSLAMAIPGTPLYEYSQQIGVIGKTLEQEEDYLIRISEDKFTNIMNYVNKTEASIEEVHYWFYLFQYAGKKAYASSIMKDNKPIKHKLLQIYKHGIKNVIINVVNEFKGRVKADKTAKLFTKIKWFVLLTIGVVLSLSALILPKAILFPIIRAYANLRFNSLKKKHKVNKGKQKYNLFVDHSDDLLNDLRITENRISKTSRQKDRSLRTFVTENRDQISPAITSVEKSMQILAKGQ
jgi:anaerobic magnesium-protoporphyrin IX monomethyl ester cyclase